MGLVDEQVAEVAVVVVAVVVAGPSGGSGAADGVVPVVTPPGARGEQGTVGPRPPPHLRVEVVHSPSDRWGPPCVPGARRWESSVTSSASGAGR